MDVVVLLNNSGKTVYINVQQGDADYETNIPNGGQLTLPCEPTPLVTYLGVR